MLYSVDMFYYLLIGIFIIALLYSCVGHAGASGYIAVMSLLAFTPSIIKPSALALNMEVILAFCFSLYPDGLHRWVY